jgi:hypothetical protein
MYFFLKICALGLAHGDSGKLAFPGAQQFLCEGFDPLADLGILQSRQQLRFLHMRKSAAQRTLHQIIVYHFRLRESPFDFLDGVTRCSLKAKQGQAGSDWRPQSV